MRLSASRARGMRGEGNHPEQRAPARVEGRERGMHGTDLAAHDRVAAFRRPPPVVSSLREALTAALHQREAQRAGTLLVGHICEHCFDAPAVLVQPAPWGGEIGVCAACQQATPARAEAPQAG
jgi:hypothetical protein